jgi:hypothetical protein
VTPGAQTKCLDTDDEQREGETNTCSRGRAVAIGPDEEEQRSWT